MSAPRLAATVSPSLVLGLAAVLSAASVAAEVTHPRGVALLYGLAIVALVLIPGALRQFLRRLPPLLSFAVCGVVLLLAAPIEPATPVVTLPWLARPVSATTAHFLLSLGVKSLLVVVWATATSVLLSERDLLEGLIGLRIPPRVTALCYLMVAHLRTVRSEIARLLRARDARGAPRGVRTLTVVTAITQTLLIRLGRRAETQGLALAARGFCGHLPLVQARPLSLTAALSLLAGGVLLVWLTRL